MAFKISFGAKGKNLLKPQNGQPPAKKPRLLDDDEPEDTNKSVEISGWDATGGGAIDANGAKKEEDKPRVIPTQPNRNWMGHKEKNGGNTTQKEGEIKALPEEEMKYGLTIVKKAEKDQNGDVAMEDAPNSEALDDGLSEEQRLEKRAMEALLTGKSAAEDHVIPQNEEEAFEHDYATAPEAPSLDDYAAVPVEGFGAALLRGMGWKDGEEIGRKKGQPIKPREVKRRPHGLGIGAKVENAVDLEVAEWGRVKGGKVPAYTPVLKRNKYTGELISEEELQKKLEAQKLVEAEERSDKESGTSKAKDRKREKYDDYEDEDERRERKKKEKERERDRRDKDRSPERGERRKERERDRDRWRDDDYNSRDKRDKRDRNRDRDSGRKDRRREDDYYDRKRDSRRDHSDDERRSEKRRDRQRERDRRDRSRSPGGGDRRTRTRDYDEDDRKRRRRDDEYRSRR